MNQPALKAYLLFAAAASAGDQVQDAGRLPQGPGEHTTFPPPLPGAGRAAVRLAGLMPGVLACN